MQGNLKVTRNAVAGVVDFGHGLVLDATAQSLGVVSVTRSAGLATQDVSFGKNMTGTTQGIDRIWTVLPTTQPTAPVPVTLTWLPENDNGLTDFSQARMRQQAATGSPWAPVGLAGNGATRSFSRNVAVLNRLTMSSAASPLPVELTALTAERQGADALLRWTTASEKNNAYFAVERSLDGQRFERIGQVAGQGNSTQRHDYTFPDAQLSRHAVAAPCYRLRQVDADGTTSYSPVRAPAVPMPVGPGLAVEAYPSPLHASEQLQLQVRATAAGPASLLVTDALGRPLLRKVLPLPLDVGTTTLALPEVAAWSPGVYLLRLQQGAPQQSLKLVRD